MSVNVDTQTIETVQRVLDSEEMYRKGLQASTGQATAGQSTDENVEPRLDLIDAHKWFNLAAMQGNQEARIYRAELANEMTSEEIAEAQKRARQYLAEHSPKKAS